MPLVIDGGRIPAAWAESKRLRPELLVDGRLPAAASLRVALVNNMPDAAMEDTELQFFDLLETAAGQLPVSVKLFSLPGVPRGDRGMQHLADFYHGIDELFNSWFDAVIVTGTEPHQPELQQEPYWQPLTELFEWAERNTTATILSCLAAHAGVLHSDGISRHPMWYKMCGVFECQRLCDHPLTVRTGDVWRFPHSRWNEVRENDLNSSGYTVLTKSSEGGVDCFVKRKRNSLFVHFQGHPEYGASTLFKEYRRDVRRFLRGERKNYPYVPHGYFDEAATKTLSEFRDKALAGPHEELMAEFPEAAATANLRRTWSTSAIEVYRNLLQYITPRRTDSVLPAPVRFFSQQCQREDLVTPER